jgi:predicted DNA-binding protein with PD1-like motif
MKSRLIHEVQGQRTYVVILDTGDEAMSSLGAFASKERMTAAHVQAIGAFEAAVIGFWDWERKEYDRYAIREQTEVVSLLGDISAQDRGPLKLHLHAVLGKRGGSTVGGHLLEGRVRPTLEVIITESPAHLRRIHDPALGLAVIKL